MVELFGVFLMILTLVFTILVLIEYLFSSEKYRKSVPKTDFQILYEFPNFLTPEECDHIIGLATPKLSSSKVYSQNDDVVSDHDRVSQQAWIKDFEDPVVTKIAKRTSQLLNLPMRNAEDLQVVRYECGGFFREHYDACNGSEEFCSRMNGSAGPRYATFLIYLNDDFEGGETAFPKLGNLLVKPQKGKGVLFFGTSRTGQSLLEESLHSGMPVLKGTKWICNKWFHLKSYK